MERDAERLERLTAALDTANLDALCCRLPHNVLLLTGYWPMLGTAIALLTRDGDLALVVPDDERALARRRWLADERIASFRPITLDQQLPLGMFDDGRYEIQRFRLSAGDRLLIVSDGVHAATPGGRPPYGESALFSTLRRTRLQPPTEAVGTVIRELREYHAGVEHEDDAVVVCLDWLR